VGRLRSCYETDCDFFQDGSGPTRLRWYFVPEGTPYLPFGTIFTSNEWLDQPEGDQDLGEVPGADRTWVDGTAPYPVRGERPCGTAEQFARGDARPTTPALNVYGGLACCPTPDEPFMHVDCAACPGGAWNIYTLIVRGVNPAGLGAGSGGSWPLQYNDTCEWAGPTMRLPNAPGVDKQYRWNLEFAPGLAKITLEQIDPGLFLFQFFGVWDCLTRLTLTRTANFPAWAMGAEVTLIPGFAPLPGPGLCSNLTTTIGLYTFSTLPVFGTRLQIRPVSGTWPLEHATPCGWQGEMLWVPGDSGRPRQTVPTELVVGPGGVATLTIRLSATYAFFADLVYQSAPGWSGSVPIALLLTSGASVFVLAPLAVTLSPPA
jgi:hypothetical protein